MVNIKSNISKGELEAEFTKQIVKFEKEFMGRGPVDARTHLFRDMVLVRLNGVLTPAEEKLVENSEGRALVKDARRRLFETSRSTLEGFVKEILQTELVEIFSDISTDRGERVIVLTVKKNFDE